MDKRLLDILCCPLSRTPLRLLGDGELQALNDAIATRKITNAAGTPVEGALSAGLITRDGRTIYRVEDDIPVLLADESIATAQVSSFPPL
jgi:uncharacterized protein